MRNGQSAQLSFMPSNTTSGTAAMWSSSESTAARLLRGDLQSKLRCRLLPPDQHELETGLAHAVSYLPIRTEHGSCQLIGWPIPKRLPSLSLNQAAFSPMPPLLG